MTVMTAEVHCLACGRYLADATSIDNQPLRLTPIGGKGRVPVRVEKGMAFCRYCGGRAFVENEIVKRTPVVAQGESSRRTVAA
jgi:ribosomal protein S27E